MKEKLLQLLKVKAHESRRVFLLLIMSFFMGVFVATFSVAAQSLFLQKFDETTDLPIALLFSGAFGLLATLLYNFLQNRIPFPLLAALSLFVITGLTAFIEFGENLVRDARDIYFFGFTAIIPFSYITLLIFWGAFGRLFNVRESRRLLGSVDQGAMIASSIAFFLIPQFLKLRWATTESLFSVSLSAIVIFLGLFIYLSQQHLGKVRSFAQERMINKKVAFADFFRNKYLLFMSLFIVVSMIATNFVEFSFFNVATLYNEGKDEDHLARLLAYFEMTIVIFAFLFDTIAQDRIIKDYGMRISLLINPILIGFFTVCALIIGSAFGYTPQDDLFIVFFIIISISRLFLSTLKTTIDETTMRLYMLPIESNIRIDVQTKITGTVTAFASLLAGALIYLITQVEWFGLLSITAFTIPVIVVWYMVTNRMHHSYKDTLQSTLQRSKQKTGNESKVEFSVSTLLDRESQGTIEEKVIYSLRLMEKLEPALYENSLVRLASGTSEKIRLFAEAKLRELGIQDPQRKELRTLAENAANASLESDLLSISPEKLILLGKSAKRGDRILAAKMLRTLTGPRTIFVLLELLRDVDPRVRCEALRTARKVNRPETWPILIELLASPTFSHLAAAALTGAGESILNTLESAFHKSGQSDIVMLRIVQIMGKIGGRLAHQLLWTKADFPDKRIVKQIIYSLRYIDYQAKGKERRDVVNILESEMSKAIWNLAAIHELPDTTVFKFLRGALQEEVQDNYNHIFMLLSLIYDPRSVQLVRENLESGDPENIAFALELIDLFLDPEMKPKLIPLLDESPTPQKLKDLQLYYPREEYTPIQVINYILNRDYNYNNRWTKACAIHASAYLDDFRVSRGLVAHLFNRDRLLQETAAWVIYNKDKAFYSRLTERLPKRDKLFLDSSIQNNQLLDGLNDGFFLFIEMVMFIKQSPLFQNINGIIVADLADKISPLDIDTKSKTKLDPEESDEPLIIVAHGRVHLCNNGRIVKTLEKGDVHGEAFTNAPVEPATEMEALERSVVFRITMADLYFLLAHNHEMVQGLMDNIAVADQRVEVRL
jgi:hypothetical protein